MHSMNFVYRSPSHRVVFGRGALDKVAAEIAALPACKPMLICSERGAGSAAAQKITQLLGLARDAVFSGITEHAPLSAVDEGCKKARALQPDCFIAFGGGSVADATKGIALAFAEGGRVTDFALERAPDGTLKGRQSTQAKLPILAITTTLSGAEMSPGFGVTDAAGKKIIIRDDSLAPSVLIYDPDLVRTVPLPLLAASAMNALAHCVEGLYSKARNPISEVLACASLPLLHNGLDAAIADESNVDAYVSMTLGAYYAAAAIFNARTALHHAICHKLAPAAGLSHGTANSIMLPHALEFNLPAARAELTRVAQLICDEEGSDEICAEEGIRELDRLAVRAGLPRRLREVGVSAELFPALAQKILSEPGLTFNPREVRSAREVEEVLHAAW